MNVLHITTWYPNRKNQKEALWIKRHIDAMDEYAHQEVLHLQVKTGKLENLVGKIPKGKQHIISIPTKRWFIIELISSLLLIFYLLRYKVNRGYDIINFHIGYPNLTYWHLIKKWVKIPMVITEHWSAYRLNFGIKKVLPRIKRIFQQDIPVIAVSNALTKDIVHFAGIDFPTAVVPNIVDTDIFNYNPKIKLSETARFFMISQWNYPKDPCAVIEAFKQFVEQHPKSELIIGGYGMQEKDILNTIVENQLAKHVRFIGILSGEQIAEELNRSTALIHISGYETFSVVCAEAICCGCPVIASNVGGIPEFINKKNGFLIKDSSQIINGLNFLLKQNYLRYKIAKGAKEKFSKAVIGEKYYKSLKKLAFQQAQD